MSTSATATSAISADAVTQTLLASFASARGGDKPYKHWFLEDSLSPAAVDAVIALPFAAPALDGVSGRREVHNATRKYFDADNRTQFPVAGAMSDALQSEAVTRAVEKTFGAKLNGTYLRIEYAQDIDGFWLEPHTDLGVKSFTFLIYLSKEPSHDNLGTDIYDTNKKHIGRSPFKPGGAMIFVPSNITYHGFEPRKIEGVRKSIIVNYVTNEWKAREQLAFPDKPIRL
jgi:hypothetical protein